MLMVWVHDEGGFEPRDSGKVQRAMEMGELEAIFVDDLDLIALQHGHINVFARFLAPLVFDNEQTRSGYFKYEAKWQDCSGQSPRAQFASLRPNTDVDSCWFAQGPNLHQGVRSKWKWTLEI